MALDWQAIKSEQVTAQIKDDEVLVVIPSPWPSAKSRALTEAIKEKAYPHEVRQFHHLHLYTGHLGAGGKKPFILLEWQKPGATALERRWLLNHLAKYYAQRFEKRKVSVYLPGPLVAEQVVYAEDFYGHFQKPIGEGTQWTSFKVLVDDDTPTNVDPHRQLRFLGQQRYRQWVNENPDSLTSLEIGKRMHEFAAARKLECRTMELKELEAEGMNLLLAVGQGSSRSPSRCHIMTSGLGKGGKPLMLLGKGITFDTGGINLKPASSFVNAMKNDMGGAALMIQLFQTLVDSGYDGPLVLAIPTCENALGDKSYKPGAIIKSRAGKDVFIDNTDAEGRLIMVDALHYAQERYQPALTITAATLTTASLRQFSQFYTPVHFANEQFRASLMQNAREWGEGFTFWDAFLPFESGNSTLAADISNCGRLPSDASIGGGSNVAAHFIRQFATLPLIHFDIFNTVWNWGMDYPGCSFGATGAVFNSLYQTIKTQNGLWGYQAGN